MLLITHAMVVTWGNPNQILDDYALYIENGFIKEIGISAELIRRYPDPAPIDAGGQFVLPGNICAHTHFYGAFARGLAIPGAPPRDLLEILKKLWWPLDKALTTTCGPDCSARFRAGLGRPFASVQRALSGYEAPCDDTCPDGAPC